MAEVVNVGLEAGDLSEFSATTGSVTAAGAAALAGTSYGQQCMANGSTPTYGTITFTTTSTGVWRLRFYINPGNLSMVSNDVLETVRLFYNTALRLEMELKWTGSVYQIRTMPYIDTGWAYIPRNARFTIPSVESYIEYRTKRATTVSSADGEAAWYIDGSIVESTVTNLDNYDSFEVNKMFVGLIAGIASGTGIAPIYYDQIVITDDDNEIGPYVAPAGATDPYQAHYDRRRRRPGDSL